MVASLGFFFLPLLELKPNRLASGINVGLLEIQGDLRYLLLFVLALSPLVVGFIANQSRRGWALVVTGNLLMILALTLPIVHGTDLLGIAETLFPEGTQISNPRVFASGAIVTGLLGGYIVLFAGLLDLEREGSPNWLRSMLGFAGIFIIWLAISGGQLDNYSLMVELNSRGERLGERYLEHFVFVIVSLTAGLIVGISLGLWANRDERAEPLILYIVGIIQTIPSLALFGVLLVPLATLGNRSFTSIFQFWIMSIIVAAIVVFVVVRVMAQLKERVRVLAMIGAFLVVFVPASGFVVFAITFGFEVVLTFFKSDDLSQIVNFAIAGYIVVILLTWIDNKILQTENIKWLLYTRYGVLILAVMATVYLFIQGTSDVIGGKELSELTFRDLGVSGIGTAPAIIALTLYSLLPLVRNTYVGLNSVDPAIIDAGRGMGMTPWQIFFKIELPLAFPVIMAGVRNAGISLVGITAVATIIGAGALGDFILPGINSTSIDLILLGAIPAVILAIALDMLLQAVQGILTSPGLKQQ